jgi:NSS family neurotransmitter:Na+ symporter
MRALFCWFAGLGRVLSLATWQQAKFFVNDAGVFHHYLFDALFCRPALEMTLT